jgi:hypothetical protein
MTDAPAPRRAAGPGLPPPPPWAPEAEARTPATAPQAPILKGEGNRDVAAAPFVAPAPTAPATPALEGEEAGEPGARILHFRPRSAPAPDGEDGEIAAEPGAVPPGDPEPIEEDLPVFQPSPLAGLWNRARDLGQRAAPAMGSAGKATLGAMGEAGKATLNTAGSVLGSTLPENVRQRGASGMLNPDDRIEIEEFDEPDVGSGESDEDESEAEILSNRVIDFDAPGHAPARPTPGGFPLARVLIPLAVVVLLGVLLFAIQGVLANQQTTQVNGYLRQAQQAEADSHNGSADASRTNLLSALEFVQKAQALDPKSAEVKLMADRIQSQSDKLDGVTRLAGLRLLADLDRVLPGAVGSPVPAADTPSAAGALTDTNSLTGTGALTDTSTGALPVAPPPGSDYFSSLLVQGDSAYLLNRGTGTLYRLTLTSSGLSPLLAPGDSVDLVGSAEGKARVAPLLSITWRPTAEGGDLAALDSNHTAYIWTPATGIWQAFALGGAAGLGNARDVAAYDGNLYLLWAKPGQISKWAAGAYGEAPADWLSPAAGNDMRSRNPLAMAIDGQIYLLLGDGRISILSAGEVQKTIALPVWPAISSPLALFTNEASASLYLVEKADKRIIRVDKAAGTLQGQMKAPIGSDAFDNLRNVYVDEAAGKLYILSGKKLYTATLPSLPTLAGTAVPALPAGATPPGPSPQATP